MAFNVIFNNNIMLILIFIIVTSMLFVCYIVKIAILGYLKVLNELIYIRHKWNRLTWLVIFKAISQGNR